MPGIPLFLLTTNKLNVRFVPVESYLDLLTLTYNEFPLLDRKRSQESNCIGADGVQ